MANGMTIERPALSVLYDREEQARQVEPLNQIAVNVKLNCIDYLVPYEELRGYVLTDDEIEFMKEINTRDREAIRLVKETATLLLFISPYNADLIEKGYFFDWSGNVWNKDGKLRRLQHGGNGYLQLDNIGIHRRLYAEFLARAKGKKYQEERLKWNYYKLFQVHHMNGNPSLQSSNCITDLKLLDRFTQSCYTGIMAKIREEIRDQIKATFYNSSSKKCEV